MKLLILCLFSQLLLAEDFAIQVEGNYTVPTDSSLSKSATFDLTSNYILKKDDALTVIYYLPEQIDHKQTMVIMRGKLSKKPLNGFVQLSGDKSKASCVLTNRLTCMINYHSLQLDPEKTKKNLLEKFSEDESLSDFLEISDVFSRDIIGLLVLKMNRNLSF